MSPDDPAERLARYRAKRDFAVTGEPTGDGRPTDASRFVIQEHHARRLHWDLRLEREGVLASWAVPKGLPEAPGTNHFAARTEDHPLEYIDFHGEIPKGSYGAGTMKIWDRGTYETLKWEDRKVEVALHGERVDARYALFAIGREEAPKDWMVHRMDPPADPDREPMPERILPMRGRPGVLADDSEHWAHEFRWDGVRVLAYSRPGELRLESAAGEVSGQYPELGRLGRALSSHAAILDGVIVAFDADGRPSRAALDRRAAATGPAEIRRLAGDQPATYVIFDLLWLDGHALMGRPYTERRERLAALGLDGDRWRTPDHVVGRGEAVLAASAAHGLDGIVAKRLQSPYVPGGRTADWIEVGRGGEPQDRPAAIVAADAGDRVTVRVDGRDLGLSNLGKILYPATGTTKRDVINYYAAVAPVLLAHVGGRALTVTRWPDGVGGKSFFQKQAPAHRPDWVPTVTLPAGESKAIDYVEVTGPAELVWLANLAALELHVPLALARAPDRPTAVVFDLDPGAPATIVECCEVALRLQGMFEHLGLESFAKTSGSKGMQVYLPVGRGPATFAQTKAFAKLVAELLARDEPELVVARVTPALRTGRVFVDWNQNDQQKTTVAAYSLRAREQPTVSTPVDWDEVRATLASGDPDDLRFAAQDVLGRLADRGDLLAPALACAQELPAL